MTDIESDTGRPRRRRSADRRRGQRRTSERPFQPAVSLVGAPGVPPEPAGEAGRRLGGGAIAACDRPFERGAQVVELVSEMAQPPHDVAALRRAPVDVRQLGEAPVVGGVPVAHRLAVVAAGEAFATVLGEREQQSVATGAVVDEQRLVDQPADDVADVGGPEMLVGAHRLGRLERAATGEHREPFEHGLFVFEQQVVAPVGDRPQGLLTWERRARTAGQQSEPVVESLRQLRHRERVAAGGGELDRERHPVEAFAQIGEHTAMRLGQLEIGDGGSCPFGEQGHCIVGVERRGRSTPSRRGHGGPRDLWPGGADPAPSPADRPPAARRRRSRARSCRARPRSCGRRVRLGCGRDCSRRPTRADLRCPTSTDRGIRRPLPPPPRPLPCCRVPRTTRHRGTPRSGWPPPRTPGGSSRIPRRRRASPDDAW